MATLLELATEIVSAHACNTTMTKDELIAEIASVYQALAALEKGEVVTAEAATEETGPAVSKKKAFGKDKVFCMICGKGFKTLTRHLNTAHDPSRANIASSLIFLVPNLLQRRTTPSRVARWPSIVVCRTSWPKLVPPESKRLLNLRRRSLRRPKLPRRSKLHFRTGTIKAGE